MAGIYDQSLDEVAAQVKTLADTIDPLLITEKSIAIVRLDPEQGIEEQFENLASVAFTEAFEAPLEGTTGTDVYAYPCHVIFTLPPRQHRDDRHRNITELLQKLRTYFHVQRRMQNVSHEDLCGSLPCKVGPGPRPRASEQRMRLFHTLTIYCWYEQLRSN